MYTLIKKKNKFKCDMVIELIGYPTKLDDLDIIVYNQDLIDMLIKEKFYPNFNKLVKQILLFINEDGDPDEAPFLLDELSRVYTTFLSNYDKYLSYKEKRSFNRNIHILSNELKQISRKRIIQTKSSVRVR